MKFFRKHPVLFLLLSAILVLLLWTLWGNTALTVTEYTIQNSKIPSAFDGFRIAQVSDLHNAQFGADNEKLLALLADTKPDMIAITGDLLDSRQTDMEIAICFVQECAKIAPTYYVPGNHEARIPSAYTSLINEMDTVGIRVLENESIALERKGSSITLTGLMDPDFGTTWPYASGDSYQILLSHRPELFDWYVRYGFDLVLTGHAHGGQFRLPFIGGLFAPHQGFLPKYTSGVHTQGGTSMVVSRGLGNSAFPLRFNNRPELIVITLKAA